MEKRSAVGFRELFNRINGILRLGLIKLGIEARTHSVTRKASIDNGPCFSQIDRGEISVSEKKIVASAQRVFNGAVLQQSSISIEKPDYDILDYLLIERGSREKNRDVNSAAYLDECLEETLAVPEIVKVFKGEFESELGESAFLEIPG
jgi:lipoate-protein ligase A